MNFEAAIDTINKDFCNLFYAKYLKGEWGIVAGYKTVPDYIARMRKQLADWQLANDCTDSLCAESKLQLKQSCPSGYTYVAPGVSAAFPDGTCMLGTCNVCPTVNPVSPIVTVLSYGALANPCTCPANPALEPFGPGCFDRHWWVGSVNQILISSFTR